jgi:hypothetical protein
LDKWKRHLEEYIIFLREFSEVKESKLRFGQKAVTASDISEQFYCEQKIEMQHRFGEIETEAKMTGTEVHETLLKDTVLVERKELWQKIYGPTPVLARETLFVAKHKDIVIAGKPDAVLFQLGWPLVVFEHKFSKRLVAYQTHHVQARIYGLLLKNMGFDTRLLLYAIVVAEPNARKDKSFKTRVVEAVKANGPKEATLELGNARIFLCKYNQENAERDIDWASKFWKKEREAIFADNENKCRACEYLDKCRG